MLATFSQHGTATEQRRPLASHTDPLTFGARGKNVHVVLSVELIKHLTWQRNLPNVGVHVTYHMVGTCISVLLVL